MSTALTISLTKLYDYFSLQESLILWNIHIRMYNSQLLFTKCFRLWCKVFVKLCHKSCAWRMLNQHPTNNLAARRDLHYTPFNLALDHVLPTPWQKPLLVSAFRVFLRINISNHTQIFKTNLSY